MRRRRPIEEVGWVGSRAQASKVKMTFSLRKISFGDAIRRRLALYNSEIPETTFGIGITFPDNG